MRLAPPFLALTIACSCGGRAVEQTPANTAPAPTPVAAGKSAASPQRVRHDITIDGHVFALWEKSPPDAKGAIVLVHGRTWSSLPDFDLQVPGEQRSLMDALASEGFRTFALDQRGYGETKRDQSQWLTPDRAAKDLAETLRWVGHKTGMKPALLGWSYGSLVSQLTAQRHADLVSALVLYGYPRGVDSQYSPGPAADQPAPRNPTTAEGAAEDFIAKEAASPATVEAFVAQALKADPIRMDWRERDQWRELDPAKIQLPTLLMHGELDPYAPADAQAKVFKAIASADKQWVVLAGGDHAAHLETTDPGFVETLLSFLRRPPRP